jgi:hypothetical protein
MMKNKTIKKENKNHNWSTMLLGKEKMELAKIKRFLLLKVVTHNSGKD